MRKDKNVAIEMRKSGKSYTEIMSALQIPPSTLSGWFGKEDWSQKIRQKLDTSAQEQSTVRIKELNRIRGRNLKQAYDHARVEAAEEFEALKYNPLFIAAMMLYWGEGDKATKDQVRLANTDAEMHKLFYMFLKNVCQIEPEKIGAHVLIYPDLDAETVKAYWSSKVGIPLHKFLKCTTIQGKHPTRRLGHGVCMVYVSSTYFKVKFLRWLELLPSELINRKYYENIQSVGY